MPTVHEESRSLQGLGRIVERIEKAVSRKQDLAVIVILVHNVDRVYASAGHIRANDALNDFHERLRGLSRDGDMVVQLSDRKFVLLLGGFRNQGHVQLAAHKIQRLVQKSSRERLEEQLLQASIGIAFASGGSGDAYEILRSAEIALLDGGRSNQSVSFYQEQAADQLITEWNLEQKLAEALESGVLELHYQPKVNLDTKEVMGVEALLRWYDRELGDISPEAFIDVAEASGLISDLTYFSIQRACRQLNQWTGTADGLTVAINTTPSIIRDLEIIDVLEVATNIWNIEAGSLVLEVTENALMEDSAASHSVLTSIREFGAEVSIDDFGTGYSSLAYLKKIPADELKIDRSFVMNMLADPRDYKIVEHAISLAKSFGLRVVAEGVVSAEMVNVLWALGCDYAQGHHICKPLPADDFLAWYVECNGLMDA